MFISHRNIPVYFLTVSQVLASFQ